MQKNNSKPHLPQISQRQVTEMVWKNQGPFGQYCIKFVAEFPYMTTLHIFYKSITGMISGYSTMFFKLSGIEYPVSLKEFTQSVHF